MSAHRLAPADLRHGLGDDGLVLRRMRLGDRDAWRRLRQANETWLAPWEATHPGGSPPAMTFGEYLRHQRRQARLDQGYTYAVQDRGELVGQLSVAGVARGSLQSAHIGYWISEHVAGRGLMTRAVAMAIDHCFGVLALHRVEINVRPENAASLRVVTKLGLREEGTRLRYLHIQDQWCDHRSFAITTEEVTGSMLQRLGPGEANDQG